jgi:hypothetical protein
MAENREKQLNQAVVDQAPAEGRKGSQMASWGAMVGVNTEQKGDTLGKWLSPSLPSGTLQIYHNAAKNTPSNP